MGRIAVDVVLLPDETMTDKAIEMNAKLVKQFGSEIVLHKEKCLPHISLAMGCIDEEDITFIEKVLETIAERYTIGEMEIVGINTSTNSKGETVSVFEVRKTKELQALHEKVMERVQPYFSNTVTSDMIYGDEQVSETTLEWIETYRENAGFSRFFPHITIGYGQAQGPEQPIIFLASKLALCHLGNNCTCKNIFLSIDFEI